MAAESKAEARRLSNLSSMSPQLFRQEPLQPVDRRRARWLSEGRRLAGLPTTPLSSGSAPSSPTPPTCLPSAIEWKHWSMTAWPSYPRPACRLLGVRRIPGVDIAFVTIGASDIDAMVKLIPRRSEQRQGEAEKPKKRGKNESEGGCVMARTSTIHYSPGRRAPPSSRHRRCRPSAVRCHRRPGDQRKQQVEPRPAGLR